MILQWVVGFLAVSVVAALTLAAMIRSASHDPTPSIRKAGY